MSSQALRTVEVGNGRAEHDAFALEFRLQKRRRAVALQKKQSQERTASDGGLYEGQDGPLA